MGFVNGRATFVRYRVGGDAPIFDETLMEAVSAHAIGRHGTGEPGDGVSSGWAAGDHVLDLNFSPEKNILEDALHLAMRVDTDKIPGDLLKAYTKIETDARADLNPSGYATKAQKAEAKEAAKLRAEAEAADGRFRRRKHYPILWDGKDNILYAGTAGASVLDRLLPLFRETFDRSVEPISSGSLVSTQAGLRGAGGDLDALMPTLPLLGESTPAAHAWSTGEATLDFVGNEFLMWLWHSLQADGDTLPLADGSEVTAMLSKSLVLDCPRGETGRDSLVDVGPTRLPEAFRALQSGKLPRKSGLILVRHGMQYEFTLQAETLAVSGLALPKVEGARGRDLSVARVESLRHFVETLDLLYDAYGSRRVGPSWTGELGRIKGWLHQAAA